ncbi:transcriptional regulator [Catellatospora sp. TT07R-123]|uniref:GAF and ANTAR domain-containing protein n=1 Tax=Catellatospora sp. TT07R-123 TaxID=2733863 RepID=UPI001B1D62EF|nr:GAF and ANTAR domain-containing protein [Catellatospora sp. TT07R-123]GHJ43473.1 transcriptional regulator [Catellatospora sp. TT07R-123]
MRATDADSFAELADALVGDVDPMQFLQQVAVTCVSVLGGAAAGVLLSDQRGGLRVAAASSEQALELLQRHSDEGPSLECFRTGRPVAVADLAACADRWTGFAAQARSRGFASALAVPMRWCADLVGVLTVYGSQPVVRDAGALRLGQALADMATIGLLQTRSTRLRETVVERMQATINNRIIVEQAKGVIAERLHLDMDRSFALLRDTASRDSRRLSDLARVVVDGSEQAG